MLLALFLLAATPAEPKLTPELITELYAKRDPHCGTIARRAAHPRRSGTA